MPKYKKPTDKAKEIELVLNIILHQLYTIDELLKPTVHWEIKVPDAATTQHVTLPKEDK